MSLAIYLLIVLPLFLMSLVVHEVSHGWVANRLGDPTAKSLGRLSLNPLRHLDPIGTVALPLLLMLTRAPIVFGWAKPVPIDIRQLGHPKQDLVWVGLAGPAANLLLAVALAVLLRVAAVPPQSAAAGIGTMAILMNLVLGVFNLIPIPPLDGSRVLVGLLPMSLVRWVAALEPFGILIVFALVWFGAIQRLLAPVIAAGMRLLVGAPGPW